MWKNTVPSLTPKPSCILGDLKRTDMGTFVNTVRNMMSPDTLCPLIVLHSDSHFPQPLPFS